MGSKPYLAHLTESKDLITTYEATRAGFVTAALEKNRLADPFVDEARTLKVKASKAKTAYDLLNIEDIQSGLLTAAGVSDKATSHLKPEDHAVVTREFIRNFLEPAGEKFVEDLVYRFLLIRGDTLGGKIRNLAGMWAQTRLTRYITSGLFIAGREYLWLAPDNRRWRSSTEDGDKENAKGLSWQTNGTGRVLLYNLKVPLIKRAEEDEKAGKNVDLCLFGCSTSDITAKQDARRIYSSPESYIALGELKGGIDPAGADEHWKTADSAISRIRDAFARRNFTPHLFFVGGAIEESMAREIWGMLENGRLSNAANLTNENQLVSIASWLCNL